MPKKKATAKKKATHQWGKVEGAWFVPNSDVYRRPDGSLVAEVTNGSGRLLAKKGRRLPLARADQWGLTGKAAENPTGGVVRAGGVLTSTGRKEAPEPEAEE